MKSLIRKIKMSPIFFAVLLFAFVSCDSSTENPSDLDSDNDGIDNQEAVPSDDIVTLWIGNLMRARKGQRLQILNSKPMPAAGNVLYRQNLCIGDSTAIYTITGGSYNTDGSYPTKEDDAYNPYSLLDTQRNNVTISFVFTDESSANASLIIDEPVIIQSQGGILPLEGNFTRPLEQGSFFITADDERLNDSIPPLGKSVDGDVFKSFRFEDIEIDDEFESYKLNAFKLRDGSDSPIRITYFDLVDLLGEKDNVIPIQIVETAVVQDGERLELTQPPNF